MRKPNSGGSVPQQTGKKRRNYERGNITQMRVAIDKALKRLGDPVVEYRKRRLP